MSSVEIPTNFCTREIRWSSGDQNNECPRKSSIKEAQEMVASKGRRNWEKTQAPLLRAALERLGTGHCHAWQNEDASAKGRLTERSCVETLAPIFPPNYRTVCSGTSPEQTKKHKSRNKTQSNTQKGRAVCQRNKMNSLKIIRASDVDIGTLQRFWHLGDSGTMAGSTYCPQSRACPDRCIVPHLLFHLLILTHKQTTKGFLTLKDNLKHERDIQTTKQYSPQENKEDGIQTKQRFQVIFHPLKKKGVLWQWDNQGILISSWKLLLGK